jgi:hypothetical protein
MSLEVRPYSVRDAEAWDQFCEGCVNATLLHTRKFLSYHGDRFDDASVTIHHDGDLVGLFPAALIPGVAGVVASHPGATYGGLVHQGWLLGSRMIDAAEALVAFYETAGRRRLVYKPLPYPYAQVPSQDDLYALFRLGALRVRCDLSSTIDLAAQRPLSTRRRRSGKKAAQVATVEGGARLLETLWDVLRGNLARVHGASPVHSLEEIRLLLSRFPERIVVRCARIRGQIEAGVVLFNSAQVWHAQYIAASETGYAHSALDLVFDVVVDEARKAGARYFDFGTSNEAAGTVLNDGLYRFKSEFGGGGVAYEHYELDLGR